MPAGVAPPGFHGKKGKSGRYSAADEALKNRVKHKAWIKTEKEMDKNIAGQIVLKDMTVKTDVMSGGKRIGGIDLFEYVEWLENKDNKGNEENKEIEQEDKDNTGRD